jgi:hypothetical protein
MQEVMQVTGLSESEERAWQAGREARTTRAQCPYPDPSREWDLWMEAYWRVFRASRLQARGDDPDGDDPEWR